MGKAYGFSRKRSGAFTLRVEAVERALLLSLAHQMADFVAPTPPDPSADPLAAFVGIDEEAAAPDDPALARLFPDAFMDDPDASVEFRRFTERDLRQAKADNARSVAAALESDEDPVRIAPDAVASWLGFLNDTRLALGTRVEITEDNHDELAGLPDDDPRLGLFHVYDWLTFLEDSLVRLLLPDGGS